MAATDRPAPHVNQLIFEVLRDHILGGVFEPGLVLRESAVSRAFGVGRVPSRMALEKLDSEKLIRKRKGHGYKVAVPGQRAPSRRRNLLEAGLVVPENLQEALSKRRWRQRIYPRVEEGVASCLVFGRFMINQSALAESFGVSRTIAHEVLANLERVGFVRHERNARWYAGPLSIESIKEMYELRWLLEPRALIQAAPNVSRAQLIQAREQIIAAQAKSLPHGDELNEIELALHAGIVHKCTNQRMRQALRNCQLPIIVTYGTVVRNSGNSQHRSGIPETLSEHRAVIELLLDGRVDKAAAALAAHIRHGMSLSLPHFTHPPPLNPDRIPPYMVQVP